MHIYGQKLNPGQAFLGRLWKQGRGGVVIYQPRVFSLLVGLREEGRWGFPASTGKHGFQTNFKKEKKKSIKRKGSGGENLDLLESSERNSWTRVEAEDDKMMQHFL